MNRRAVAAILIASAGLAACGPNASPADPSASGWVPAPQPSSSSQPTSAPQPTTSPPPSPQPLPPLQPGRARGEVIFVQRAEDASLVSGDKPIRLTLARTGNVTDWFSSPTQRRFGTMTTAEAMQSMGWRVADDGTTSVLPRPRPNAVLSFAGGVLPMTIYRANVRADGTLVLDINPMGPMPETVSSFGPVSLTMDGVPGVLVIDDAVIDDTVIDDNVASGVASRVVITGERNQQAVVQLLGADGSIKESRFLSRDIPSATGLGDVGPLTDVALAFEAPTREREGRVTLTGSSDGQVVERVLARWSLPAE